MEIKRIFLSKLTNNIRTNNRLFLILLLFLLAEVLINPIGEFPLNDDWAYAKIIKIIMLKGVVEPSEWGEAFFLTQMIWGLAFCKIFGFWNSPPAAANPLSLEEFPASGGKYSWYFLTKIKI